jgi:hypothetical protein
MFMEILVCFILIAVLVVFGLDSEYFHTGIAVLSSMSVVLLLLALIISAVVAYATRTDNHILSEQSQVFAKIPERQVMLVMLTLAVGLFFIPVFNTWSTGAFHENNAGGFLPVFDGGAYYSGAEHILDNGNLDTWNQRRPITSLFLAARLILTNFDLRLAILFQAALLGIIVVYTALSVSRTFDKYAGLVMFFALFSLSAFFISENLSEPLGIFFGCLSFILIWYGVTSHDLFLFLAGIFFYTIGFMARPGPFLFFVAFVVMAGYCFNNKNVFYWKHAAVSFVPVGLGVLLHQCLFWLYGNGQGLAFGNYAAVIYGLASGGKGWEQYLIDFPNETAHLPEGQLYPFIYQKSFELIYAHPWQFISAIMNGYISAPFQFFNQSVQILTSTSGFPELGFFPFFIAIIVIVCLIWGIIRFFISSRQDSIKLLFSLCIVSTFLSVPFFFTDGGIRTLVVIYPYFALGVTLSVLGWRSLPVLPQGYSYCSLVSIQTIAVPVFMGMAIIGALFVVPILGPAFHETMNDGKTPPHITTCSANETSFTMRVDTGMPHLHQMNSSDTRHIFAPRIRPDVFSSQIEWYYLDRYYDLTGFMNNSEQPILFYGYDPEYDHAFLVLSPDGVIGPQRRIIRFCAESRNTTLNPGYWVYVLNSTSLVIS